MPPTIMVTLGMASAATAAPTIPSVAANTATTEIESFLCTSFLLVESLFEPLTASDAGDGVVRRRFGTPGEQAVLEDRHQRFPAERQDADHQHGAEDAVRIEGVLCGRNDQPQTVLSPQKFADDRADDRKPERHVEAGDDPGHGRG